MSAQINIFLPWNKIRGCRLAITFLSLSFIFVSVNNESVTFCICENYILHLSRCLHFATYLILCKIDTSTTFKPNLWDWQTEWKYFYLLSLPVILCMHIWSLWLSHAHAQPTIIAHVLCYVFVFCQLRLIFLNFQIINFGKLERWKPKQPVWKL